jgi:hypothetical protein
MKKKIIPIIIAAIIIPLGVYTISPFFIERQIDESFPVSTQTSTETIPQQQSLFSGSFVGVMDGVHNAQGNAKIIRVSDIEYLRLEDFRATNGPDLHVYLATDKQATDFVDLGSLKANNGNQNYQIPEGTDLAKYDMVLIWCQPFSVLFGSAELK